MTSPIIPLYDRDQVPPVTEILAGQVMARLVRAEGQRPTCFRSHNPQEQSKDTRRHILDFVKGAPGSTAAQITEGTTITRQSVNSSTGRMINKGLLRREGPMPYRYFLAEESA
jgi:hypothetical protein